MPYYYEDDYAIYGNQRIENALRRWRPGGFETFKSGAEESFSQYNTLGYIGNKLAEWTAPDETPIEENDWNESHPLYRDDVAYTENMTEGVALVRATQSDRATELNFTRRNVDFWSLPNLSGVMLGGLPDPVNLAGMGGFVGRMGTVAKVAQKMPVIRHTAPVLQGATDTMIAESLFQFTRAASVASQGGDLDQFSVFGEIALAGAFGGMFSMMPMAWQVAKKAPEVMHFTWLADAKSAMARQEPVTTFGTGGLIEDGVTTASKEADSTNFRNIDDENDIFREHEGPNKIHESTTPLDESVTPPKNEPVDDRTYSQKFVDDVSEALLNPVQTARNAAEKYIHCVRFLKGKG
jgi:hypothetical protein